MSIPESHARPLHRRAAVAVWVTSGIMLALSVCCVGSALILAVTPLEKLHAADSSGQIPAETWAQIEQIHPDLNMMAGFMTFLFLIPSAVLIVLGFSVRDGKSKSTRIAYRITLVLAILTGFGIVMSLPNVFRAGPVVILQQLPSAGLLWLLVWCAIRLKRALAQPIPVSPESGWDGDDDPWEHLL